MRTGREAWERMSLLTFGVTFTEPPELASLTCSICRCGVACKVVECCGMLCGSARLVCGGVESIKST